MVNENGQEWTVARESESLQQSVAKQKRFLLVALFTVTDMLKN